MRMTSGARACKAAPLIYFMLMPHFSDGRSPLHYAAEHGHSAIVQFLMSAGADLHMRDE